MAIPMYQMHHKHLDRVITDIEITLKKALVVCRNVLFDSTILENATISAAHQLNAEARSLHGLHVRAGILALATT